MNTDTKILEHERKVKPHFPREPRGIRNNNPLNIRYNEKNNWKGKLEKPFKLDKDFEEFVRPYWGLRAAFILLHKYIEVEKRRTVRRIINKWAPANENNTQSYVEVVKRRACFEDTEEIRFADLAQMMNLVAEMCYVENGKYVPALDIAEGYYLACHDLNIRPCIGRGIYADKWAQAAVELSNFFKDEGTQKQSDGCDNA